MEGAGGDRKRKTSTMALSWGKLMPPSPEGEVEGERGEPVLRMAMEGGEEESSESDEDFFRKVSDKELHEKIERQRMMLSSGEMPSRLPDGGRKLKKQLKRLEAEQERRKRQKEDNKCKKVIPVIEEFACKGQKLKLNVLVGAADDLSQGAPPSKSDSQSTFYLHFCSKLDDKGATEPFSEELSTLNHSKQKTLRVNGPCLTQRNTKFGSSSREVPFKSLNHQLNNAQSEDNKCKKVIPVIEEFACKADDLSQGAPPSKSDSQSTFYLHFCSKLDDKGATEPFSEELSTLNHSKQKTLRVNGPCLTQRNTKFGSSSREVPFKSLNHQLNNAQSVSQLSVSLLNQHDGCSSVSSCFAMKRNTSVSQPTLSSRRNRETVVLVDEELEIDLRSQAGPMDQSTKELQIYYPSRDDPETIEICYTDMECLTPGSYLSSNIMNFYIRYLQQPASPNSRKRHDYHFFNTYFYNKLQEIESDKETFKKFRRWWKGVNIFEKAYIFLPIHEISHWSLVIICIPNKEDESGPIILHLDSLGMHNSRKIFPCVKSFLVGEWEYLRHEEVLPKLPIADRIWKKLSRRIGQKVIEVPQQKNESDCGVFVLYFMERFIEEAPERLRKKDIHMFGRKWFQAEEASGLREKIFELLREMFENARREQMNQIPVL